ncbi:MAG: RNA-binding S4 domain-containing protein [candidate division WOR-3 bacterium]
MRIDTFLKLTGFSRSRNVVKSWQLKVNGLEKKPSYEIKEGDVVEFVDEDGRHLILKVLAIPKGSVSKKARKDFFQILSKSYEVKEKESFLKWLFENF